MENPLRSPVLTTFPPGHMHSHSLNCSLRDSQNLNSPYMSHSELRNREYNKGIQNSYEIEEISAPLPSKGKQSPNSQLEFNLDKSQYNEEKVGKDRKDIKGVRENQENIDPLKVDKSESDHIPASKSSLQDCDLKPRHFGCEMDRFSNYKQSSKLTFRSKRVKRYSIEDFLHITRGKISFGTHTPGQIKEEDLEISNKSNQNVLVQIEVDCFNSELQETEEYVYSIRRSYTHDYNDRHYVIMTPFSTASFRAALKVPLVKCANEIIGEIRISIQGLQSIYRIGMESNVVTPKVICPKELYHVESGCNIIKINVKTGKKQETKIPLKNVSNVPVTLELGFYNPKHIELNRKYCCLIYPNVITLPPNGTAFLTLQVRSLSTEEEEPQENNNVIESLKEVLVARIIDSAVFYSFALSIDLTP